MNNEYDNERFFDEYKKYPAAEMVWTRVLNNDFELKAVKEAKPSEDMMNIPGMKDELRRPMMLLVKASKKYSWTIKRKSMCSKAHAFSFYDY